MYCFVVIKKKDIPIPKKNFKNKSFFMPNINL